ESAGEVARDKHGPERIDRHGRRDRFEGVPVRAAPEHLARRIELDDVNGLLSGDGCAVAEVERATERAREHRVAGRIDRDASRPLKGLDAELLAPEMVPGAVELRDKNVLILPGECAAPEVDRAAEAARDEYVARGIDGHALAILVGERVGESVAPRLGG